MVVEKKINMYRRKLFETYESDKSKFFKYKPSKESLLLKINDINDIKELYDHLMKDGRIDFINETIENSFYNVISVDCENPDTRLSKSQISDKLSQLYRNSEEAKLSYGSPILYLVIGTIRVVEKSIEENIDTEKIKQNYPILFVPVELKKLSYNRYALYPSKKPMVSPVIEQILDNSQGITNFPIEDSDPIITFFSNINRELERSGKNWELVESVFLDLFDVAPFIIHQDLDPVNWKTQWGDQLERHPVLQQIYTPGYGDKEERFSETVSLEGSLEETYQVFPDDSSHLVVIEDVISGENIVVRGPPGTGKSQAIVSMITELLGQDKNVLFVSEKKEALDVVYQRLKFNKLDDFCFVLHDDAFSNSALFGSVDKAWANQTKKKNLNFVDTSRYPNLKVFLDGYKEMLSIPRCNREKADGTPLNVYDLIGLYSLSKFKIEQSGNDAIIINFENANDWTSNQWNIAIKYLKELEAYSETFSTISNNVWDGCKVDMLNEGNIADIKNSLNSCFDSYSDLMKQIDILCNNCATKKPLTVEEVTLGFVPSIELLKKAQSNIGECFGSMSNAEDCEQYLDPSQVAYSKNILEKLNNYKLFQNKLQSIFENDVFEISAQSKHLAIFDRSKSDERVLHSDEFINNTHKRIKRYYRESAKQLDGKALLRTMRDLKECLSLKEDLSSINSSITKQFGPYWNYEESNSQRIKYFIDWVDAFNKINNQSYDERRIYQVLLNINEISIDVSFLNEKIQEFEKSLNTLLYQLNPNPNQIFDNDVQLMEFDLIKSKLNEWIDNLDKLPMWSSFNKIKEESLNTVAKPLLTAGYDIPLNIIVPTFKINYAYSILNLEEINNDIFTSFKSVQIQENKISEFIQLENEIFENNSIRLWQKIVNTYPSYEHSAGRTDSVEALRNEIFRKNSKRGVSRATINNIKTPLLTIKPCFMMSPTSVAKNLPHNMIFDVVIFDEASQLKTENALVAILRAKQVVICGDENQLPPMDFLTSISENYDYASKNALENQESLLERFGINLKRKTLNWHYRSRHESLIAISNKLIYDNRLWVHPSPLMDNKDIGIDFKQHNYPYEGGTNKNDDSLILSKTPKAINSGEAELIVKDVFDYYLLHEGEKTIGIATSNLNQRNLIMDLIDSELIKREDQKANEFFNSNDKFFVKNIESVQGDERDAIFISFVYGFNKDKSLIQKFGPINKDKSGIKRLNVLVTRAKEKCTLYANFSPEDIDISNNSTSLIFLKTFMQCARDKNLASISKESNIFSDLGEYISSILSPHYNIKKSYGVGDFKIDIAIENDKGTGFIAGIMLDGPQFYSENSTRDRVRTHFEVLEGLGWNLYRIWSPEWLQDSATAEKRLFLYLENLTQDNSNTNMR